MYYCEIGKKQKLSLKYIFKSFEIFEVYWYFIFFTNAYRYKLWIECEINFKFHLT